MLAQKGDMPGAIAPLGRGEGGLVRLSATPPEKLRRRGRKEG